MKEHYHEDHPEVIKAKAEAKAKVMEARAKMDPFTQSVYAFFDGVMGLVKSIGCLLVLLVIAVAIFAPRLFEMILK